MNEIKIPDMNLHSWIGWESQVKYFSLEGFANSGHKSLAQAKEHYWEKEKPAELLVVMSWTFLEVPKLGSEVFCSLMVFRRPWDS